MKDIFCIICAREKVLTDTVMTVSTTVVDRTIEPAMETKERRYKCTLGHTFSIISKNGKQEIKE